VKPRASKKFRHHVPSERFVPKQLLDELNEHIPGFRDERHAFQIAWMLWCCVDPSREHRAYPGAITLHTRELRALFGEVAQFSKANRKPSQRYFEVSQARHNEASAKDSYTQAYTPRPWMHRALERVINSFEGLDYVDEQKQNKATYDRAIRSTDIRGSAVRRWKGVNVTSLIPVNIDNLRLLQTKLEYLQRLIAEASGSPTILEQYELNERTIKRALQQTKVLIAESLSKRHPGMLSIRYLLHQSGRLYAAGLNLQSCKREVRQAALAGYWDVDINTCHFAIMVQLANRFGLSCPVIEDYVLRKKYWRGTIAQDVGTTQQLVKKALNALGYGAPRSASPYTSISKDLGKECAEAFFRHDLPVALKKDIDAATKVILTNYPMKNNTLVNASNRSISVLSDGGKKVGSSSLMAHLLQGVEALALEVAVRAYGRKVLLLQHDGFSATEFIEPGFLTASVLEETGYDLSFDVERIKMPLESLEITENSFNKKLNIQAKPNTNKDLEPFWPVKSGTIAFLASDVPPVYPLPMPLMDPDF